MSQPPITQELQQVALARADARRPGWLGRLAERGRQTFSGSINRQILSAAITVAAFTMFVKVAAMGKEVLIAAWFGTGDAIDAFLVAFVLPSYAINVIAGSMNAALIPTFVDVREKHGHGEAQRLFSGVLVFSLGLLSLAMLLMAVVAPVLLPLLCTGFSPGKATLTMQLFYLLVPGVVIAGVATTCEAALNAGERFAYAALAPGAVPLTAMLALVVVGGHCGIEALAIGMVVGFSIELLACGYCLRMRGISVDPRWFGFSQPMRRVIKQYLAAVAASALMCSTLLVDQGMASMLAPGSVSALNYGNKLVALVLTIGTTAFGTAVLPYLSKMVAAGDWNNLRHTLRTYLRLILLITVPIVGVGVFLSEPVTALLFERGQFTPADTKTVSWIQTMYLFQVPFYSITILFVRVISSLEANHLLMWGTAISVVVNVVVNYVLMQAMGVAGIALSTSIVHALLAGFLGLVVWNKLRAVSVSS